MKLRWLVRETKYSAWDSRYEVATEHTSTGNPVLQHFAVGKWQDVPTVTIVEDLDKKGKK